MNFQPENISVVHLDETNINLLIFRTQGRSKKTTRCAFVSAGSGIANVNLIDASSIRKDTASLRSWQRYVNDTNQDLRIEEEIDNPPPSRLKSIRLI